MKILVPANPLGDNVKLLTFKEVDILDFQLLLEEAESAKKLFENRYEVLEEVRKGLLEEEFQTVSIFHFLNSNKFSVLYYSEELGSSEEDEEEYVKLCNQASAMVEVVINVSEDWESKVVSEIARLAVSDLGALVDSLKSLL